MVTSDNNRAKFAALIAGLPQLTNIYKEVVPLNGDGGAGRNCIVLQAVDGKKRVLLKFSDPWNDDNRRIDFEREYRILKKLKGQPGIVEIQGDMQKIDFPLLTQDGSIQVSIGLSYYPIEESKSDVEKLIYKEERKRSMRRNLELFRDTCKAVKRLHDNKVYHRNLKPKNLLIFSGGIIKIGEFRAARWLGEAVRGIYDIYDYPRDNLSYTPPELICETRECDQAFLDGDFYSLGAILFELITGKVFGDIVYSLEYLNELAIKFRNMRESSREAKFIEQLPQIMKSHPLPRLAEITENIPPSIEKLIEELYKKLTDPRMEVRIKSFDETYGRLGIMIRILKWEEVSGLKYIPRI